MRRTCCFGLKMWKAVDIHKAFFVPLNDGELLCRNIAVLEGKPENFELLMMSNEPGAILIR